jgi:hypothetical protein
MVNNRLKDLIQFYALLARLEHATDGPYILSAFNKNQSIPKRGVYFFMESNEIRTDSGNGLRVVRIGTHGLKLNSKSTLSQRLSQHRGTMLSGGGSHRGSIFRLLVGTTIIDNFPDCSTWGQGSTAKGMIRTIEGPIEKEVSSVIGRMPFLLLNIDDAAEPSSLRGVVERNAIALLSNFEKHPLDQPSAEWIGHKCDRIKVRQSGLWNQNHVDQNYDPDFLQVMNMLIEKMEYQA